jgi:hypothetical protein
MRWLERALIRTRARPTRISEEACNNMESFCLFQDELEEMDNLVKAAIRREKKQDLFLVVTAMFVIAILTYFLTRLIGFPAL